MQTFPCNYSWHITVWSYKTKSYSWITDLLYKRCCYWHNSLAYGISVSVIKVVACTKAVKNSINVCKCKDTFHLFLLWAFFFSMQHVHLNLKWAVPLDVLPFAHSFQLCAVLFVPVKLRQWCRLHHKAPAVLTCRVMKVHWWVRFSLTFVPC